MNDGSELLLRTLERLIEMANDKEPLTMFKDGKNHRTVISIGKNTYYTFGHELGPMEIIDAYAYIKAQKETEIMKMPDPGRVIL